MNATTYDGGSQPSRRSLTWAGAGIVAGLVLGMAALARIEPMTMGVAYGIAGVGAAGAMAMAWLMQHRDDYPRWAWWTTGGVMAVALLASVPLIGDAAIWEEEVRTGTWMLPWFLLLMGITRRSEPVCAATGARAGWIMVASGTAISVLLLGARAIVGWFAGLFVGLFVV